MCSTVLTYVIGPQYVCYIRAKQKACTSPSKISLLEIRIQEPYPTILPAVVTPYHTILTIFPFYSLQQQEITTCKHGLKCP